MNNHFPKMKKKETEEVFVLPNGQFYVIHWGENSNMKIVNLVRQVATDCGAEYLGVL